jgi:hypothetical protein
MPNRPKRLHLLTATLLLGLGAAGLSGCYVLPPYAGPAYGPSYQPPPGGPPPPPGPPAGPPRPGGYPAPPPPPGGGPGSAQTCQTITVEGHWETRVSQTGQRASAWVPTHQRQVCQ